MLATQSLNHPWLNPKIQETTNVLQQSQADSQKKINTKNLRRFVIRRRWQVSFFVNEIVKIQIDTLLLMLRGF